MVEEVMATLPGAVCSSDANQCEAACPRQIRVAMSRELIGCFQTYHARQRSAIDPTVHIATMGLLDALGAFHHRYKHVVVRLTMA